MKVWKTYKIQEHGKEYIVEEYKDEHVVWNHLGKRHRDYGPASKYSNGSMHWYKCGQSHRDDGHSTYWLDNKRYYYLSNTIKSFYDLLFYEESERGVKWIFGKHTMS
jgi:hypothetical protein